MRAHPYVLAVALSLATVASASAVELKPAKASSVELGTYRGTIYYTPGPDGYRVVATLIPVNVDGGASSAVRLVTTLNANQTVTLSVPGTLSASGRETTVAFSRRGDTVEVASAE
ncbi:hypothetical protein [uncultured Methylobacterium sp.]|uniref:hypothetical protein n=1 Tax=uncultured Methylobacterium sp. TaxID=157278 RepID=UPI0035CA4E82